MTRRQKNPFKFCIIIVALLIIILPITCQSAAAPTSWTIFYEALDIINREYYGEVNSSDLTKAAIKGFLSAVGTANTQYIEPDAYINGKQYKLNKKVEMTDFYNVMDKVYKGYKIDNNQIPLLIYGSIDGMVKSLNDPFSGFIPAPKVERSISDIQVTTNITYRIIDTNIGYICISNFTNTNMATDFESAMSAVDYRKNKFLIIDLRNNVSGEFNNMFAILRLFNNVNDDVKYIDRNPYFGNTLVKSRQLPYTPKKGIYKMPIVILVNRYTAGPAEVIADCFKQSGRGVLIGDTTMGMTIFQNVRPLQDGSLFRISAGEYVSLNGTKLTGVGVTANRTVLQNGSEDTQLKEAIRLTK